MNIRWLLVQWIHVMLVRFSGVSTRDTHADMTRDELT